MRKRAAVVVTATARVRRWPAGGARIVAEVRSLFRLPVLWLVLERVCNGNERVLSRHRKQTAAWRAAGVRS